MLYNGFQIEANAAKTQGHTIYRKKQSTIPLAGANEFFRGSKKRHPLLRNGVLKPQMAKASFRCNFFGEVLGGRLGSNYFRFHVSGYKN